MYMILRPHSDPGAILQPCTWGFVLRDLAWATGFVFEVLGDEVLGRGYLSDWLSYGWSNHMYMYMGVGQVSL